jgi:hypothetical protein
MRIAMLALAGAGLALTALAVESSAKDEPKPFVKVPKTWEAAVDEAKKLNLPIVVHSHGWY